MGFISEQVDSCWPAHPRAGVISHWPAVSLLARAQSLLRSGPEPSWWPLGLAAPEPAGWRGARNKVDDERVALTSQ